MGAYTNLSYHIVFGTRFRRPTIHEGLRERLYEYVGGIIRAKKGHLLEIGGIADHVHILANIPPSVAVSDFLRDIKANSARWMNELPVADSRFEWQKGYAAFSVSYSQIPSVRRYLQTQEEHHRVKSFEEEYVEFLQRHEIEIERRYLFEGELHG